MVQLEGLESAARYVTQEGCTVWSFVGIDEWVGKACELALASTKRRFIMEGPGGPGAAEAFVKVVRRRPGHGIVHRLRKSRATLEGLGYQAFGNAGFSIPPLLALGEQRRLGLFQKGFVATERMEAPDLSDVIEGDLEVGVVRRLAELLGRIHAAGLVHGDPLLRNFLLLDSKGADSQILPIDLGGFGPATPESRRRDLIRFLGSVLFHSDDLERAQRAIPRYEAYAPSLGEGESRLLEDAIAYRQRKETKEAEREARRVERRRQREESRNHG